MAVAVEATIHDPDAYVYNEAGKQYFEKREINQGTDTNKNDKYSDEYAFIAHSECIQK